MQKNYISGDALPRLTGRTDRDLRALWDHLFRVMEQLRFALDGKSGQDCSALQEQIARLQEQIAKAEQAGSGAGGAFTTLKHKNNTVTVNVHGIDWKPGMMIACQQANRRKERKRWLWGCRGYSLIAETHLGDNGPVYPPVPSWMPNAGVPQWQWPIAAAPTVTDWETFSTEAPPAGYWPGAVINLGEWLLDFLKPFSWNQTAGEPDIFETYNQAGFVGVPRGESGKDSNRKYLEFRFFLLDAEGTVLAEPMDRLRVGLQAGYDEWTTPGHVETWNLKEYVRIV